MWWHSDTGTPEVVARPVDSAYLGDLSKAERVHFGTARANWRCARRAAREAAGGNGRGCPFTRMPLSHVIVNLVIEPTPDGARGKSYLVYPGIDGQFVDDDHTGHDGGYQDTYVKTADGWRFKERIHVYPPQIPGEYTGTPNSELAASAPSDAG